MANATDITTISLHAATDPRRSGAYRSREYCVDYFAEAAARYRNATPDKLKWGTRIEDDAGVMALIPVEAVTARVDQAMAKR
jgi:heptosyltransferase I